MGDQILHFNDKKITKKNIKNKNESSMGLFYYQIQAFLKTLEENKWIQSKFLNQINLLDKILNDHSLGFLEIFEIIDNYLNSTFNPESNIFKSKLNQINKIKKTIDKAFPNLIKFNDKQKDRNKSKTNLKSIEKKFVSLVEVIHQIILFSKNLDSLSNNSKSFNKSNYLLDKKLKNIFDKFKSKRFNWEKGICSKLNVLQSQNFLKKIEVIKMKKKFLIENNLVSNYVEDQITGLSELSQSSNLNDEGYFLTPAYNSVYEISSDGDDVKLHENEEERIDNDNNILRSNLGSNFFTKYD